MKPKHSNIFLMLCVIIQYDIIDNKIILLISIILQVIKVLDLCNCKITDSCIQDLAEMLEHNKVK